MRLGKKLLLILLGAAVLIFGGYQLYLHLHFRMYDGYKQYIQERGGNFEEGTPFKELGAGGNVPDMVLAAENEFLELYFNPETTNAAVYDKRSGEIAYVCPPNPDDDPLATGLNNELLKSPITVDFFTARRTPGSYNSYRYAIAGGQFTNESIQNGVRVNYSIGDLTLPTGLVPIYLGVERMAEILPRIPDERERANFEARYIESPAAPDGFLELREGARGAANIRRLTEALTAAGYTDEELQVMMSEAGVEGTLPVSFGVSLEYRLDGDTLDVQVPTDQITENGGAMVDKIHMLRNFNAGGSEEEGYMLVPNGAGSLIRFNNGKTGAEDYRQDVYEQDMLSDDYMVFGNTEMARFPVFGIQKQNSRVFAVIEEGQSFAQVTAGIAGKANSYNTVYPIFIVRGSASLAMFGTTGLEADLPMVEKNIYKANLTVRYKFLTEEYDGYSGMARYYREKLESEGVLAEKESGGDVPLYLDLIGAAMGTKFIAAVPYEGMLPMTTYEQAGEIVSLFNDAGIQNQVINYQGWHNRGYYHDVTHKIKLIKQLGSEAELEELSSRLEAQGGKLYADVVFQEVRFRSKDYNWQQESSRYYGGGYVGVWGQVDPLSYEAAWSFGYVETVYDLMSPKFLPRYIDSFVKNIERYDITGVSLRDLGNTLTSDRKRTEFIDRESALSIVEAQLERLNGIGKDIMVSGGNVYAFKGADDIINVPLAHNESYIVDEEVPFYQMVVHGYIPYAGYAVNRSDINDQDGIILQLLEYGASPHFTLTYEEASEMKYTGLNRFNSTYYQNWTDTAVNLYNTVNPVLSKVSGSLMVTHEVTPDGLRCVTYDNGVQIIVNRTVSDLTYEGITVPARGYAVREGVAA
ncbi:MAG: DUF5696 domain-containing protein [Oscillospiraceae bacterium]|jgi:hypothetical protein|nr:DUF5696 domain-containing protein [Oscillospiraceae bacterium]